MGRADTYLCAEGCGGFVRRDRSESGLQTHHRTRTFSKCEGDQGSTAGGRWQAGAEMGYETPTYLTMIRALVGVALSLTRTRKKKKKKKRSKMESCSLDRIYRE